MCKFLFTFCHSQKPMQIIFTWMLFEFWWKDHCYLFSFSFSVNLRTFRDYLYSFCFPISLVWFLNVITEFELSSFNSNGIMPNPLRLAGKRFWAWCHLAFLRKGLLMKHRKKIRLFQTCKALKWRRARSDTAFTNTPNILWHGSETAQEIPS